MLNNNEYKISISNLEYFVIVKSKQTCKNKFDLVVVDLNKLEINFHSSLSFPSE